MKCFSICDIKDASDNLQNELFLDLWRESNVSRFVKRMMSQNTVEMDCFSICELKDASDYRQNELLRYLWTVFRFVKSKISQTTIEIICNSISEIKMTRIWQSLDYFSICKIKDVSDNRQTNSSSICELKDASDNHQNVLFLDMRNGRRPIII